MGLRELDADELADWLSRGENIRLIDVRTPAEVARGVIPEAENLPLHLLPLQVNDLPADPKVVFYCRSGARSAQACLFMGARGRGEVERAGQSGRYEFRPDLGLSVHGGRNKRERERAQVDAG